MPLAAAGQSCPQLCVLSDGRQGWLNGTQVGSRCLYGDRVGCRVSLPSSGIMVRNVDDLDFQLPSHAQDMLDGLQQLRSLPKLADVTLLVGGRELPCHRSLLALSSPYFHAMFSGDFAESFSARVELPDVEPAVVGQLLDFVYTGRLTITQTNVEALTRTASRLHFPAVQKVCGRYLQQQLDATNCLGICEFGEQQGLLGVAAKAWAFLRENFEAVAQEDEFLQLSRERLATCLASDLLQMQPEQSRLEALLRWVRHDAQARAVHLPELLSLVHLDAVPRPCMQQLLATEPLIQESEACQEALSQGHSGVMLGLPPKMEEVLVVVGGRALEEDEGGEEPTPQPGNFAFYNTKARRWTALPDFPDYHKWGFSLAALNNDVYVTGGSRGTQTDTWSTTQAWCFPLKEAAWKPVAPMLKARTNHASAALNGEIYAIGDAWSVIASPFLPKYLSSPRCAALQGGLYLIGDNTKKVYVYDPGANLWQKVQSQHSLHENGALVPLGDALYVTGGRWQGMDGDYRVEMEAYDTVRDSWTRHGALPRLWLYHSASSIFLDVSKWTQPFGPAQEH
ncbi:kelch-like protein 30 isoform 2-T2 [Callospermophilus lateralis]|uniref:kelch-like protein 30 isoform X2 n=1 Tax=Callospermophilus lateralis TaxID=76772 RepID=UPI0040547AD3